MSRIYGTSMQEKCKWLEEKKAVFDFAYPVDYAYQVQEKTGLWPHGIVWLYDKHARGFGRPYPITFHAWIVLKLYGETIQELSL